MITQKLTQSKGPLMVLMTFLLNACSGGGGGGGGNINPPPPPPPPPTDNTPPEIDSVTAVGNSGTITVTAVASDLVSTTLNYEWSDKNGNLTSCSDSTTCDWDSMSVNNGTETITVVVTDEANNSANESVDIVVSNPDDDGDGYANQFDAFPNDPFEWVDSDGDGYGDNGDAFPNDPTEWEDRDDDGLGDEHADDVVFKVWRSRLTPKTVYSNELDTASVACAFEMVIPKDYTVNCKFDRNHFAGGPTDIVKMPMVEGDNNLWSATANLNMPEVTLVGALIDDMGFVLEFFNSKGDEVFMNSPNGSGIFNILHVVDPSINAIPTATSDSSMVTTRSIVAYNSDSFDPTLDDSNLYDQVKIVGSTLPGDKFNLVTIAEFGWSTCATQAGGGINPSTLGSAGNLTGFAVSRCHGMLNGFMHEQSHQYLAYFRAPELYMHVGAPEIHYGACTIYGQMAQGYDLRDNNDGTTTIIAYEDPVLGFVPFWAQQMSDFSLYHLGLKSSFDTVKCITDPTVDGAVGTTVSNSLVTDITPALRDSVYGPPLSVTKNRNALMLILCDPNHPCTQADLDYATAVADYLAGDAPSYQGARNRWFSGSYKWTMKEDTITFIP